MVTKEHDAASKGPASGSVQRLGPVPVCPDARLHMRFGSTPTLEYIDERESSKRCSRGGHLQPMPHNPRTDRCQHCGLVMDRDEHRAVTHAPAVRCPAPV